MPHNITGTNTFTNPVPTYSDGDPVAQASNDPAVQALANRDVFMNTLITSIDGRVTTIEGAFSSGTFTPSLVADGTNNVTMSAQNGTYQKIGRAVIVEGRLVGSIGASTGSLRIQGLPYAVSQAGTAILRPIGAVMASDAFLSSSWGQFGLCLGFNGQTYAYIEVPAVSSGSVSASIGTAFVASQPYDVRFQLAYITT